MTTSEVLRAARAAIGSPEKWWRGYGHPNASNGHCVDTAIRRAAGIRSGWTDAHRAFCRSVEIPEDFAPWNLYGWQDAHERTHADVMAAFDRAIAAEEAKEQLTFPSEWVPTEVPA